MDLVKSDHLPFLSKIVKIFKSHSKSEFLSFMTQVNQTMEVKQNQIYFHGTYSNLTLFFIGHKILKYSNNFL